MRRSFVTWKIGIVVSAAVAVLAPIPARWVEHGYSTGAYLWFQRSMTPLSNLAAFAILDLLAIVGLGGLLTGVMLRMRRPSGWMRRAGLVAADVLVAAAAIVLVFLAVWGLNYRREALGEKLDWDRERVTETRLVELAQQTAVRLNELYPQAHGEPWRELTGYPGPLADAFAEVQRDLGLPREARPGVPKRSLLGGYFRRAAIDGMTDPFFLEILVNPEVLPFERPAIVAHEWAHLAGFADEAEASFVGWLTCLRGGFQEEYSAWLTLFPHLAGALAAADARAVIARLDAGPRDDLEAVVRRLRRAHPAVRQAARRVYDRFLKANRVRAGIASYDAVVLLVAGTRFDPGQVPALRRRARR